MSVRGGCLCGQIQFEFDGDSAAWMEHCHCSMCRKVHGASFVTWIDVPRARFRWRAGEEKVQRYASSPEAERLFCGRCGSSLVWQSQRSREYVSVAAGVLDDDPGCRPRAHIFVASRAPWVEPEPSLPQFDKNRPKP